MSSSSKQMTMADDPSKYLDWQDDLKEGDEVLARWANLGKFYEGTAKIDKINTTSFSVSLVKPIEDYKAGEVVEVPKMTLNTKSWGHSNGVFPLGEVVPTEVEVETLNKVLAGESVRSLLLR